MKFIPGTPKSETPKTTRGQTITRKNVTRKSTLATKLDGEVVKIIQTGKKTDDGLSIVRVVPATVKDKKRRDEEIIKGNFDEVYTRRKQISK